MLITELIFATNNANKVAEIKAISQVRENL